MLKILVVDDNSDIRKIVIEILKLSFNEILCTEADSGHQAEQLILSNSSYDIIISDINMPDGDGYSLLKVVEKTCQNSYFIFFSFNYNWGDEAHSFTSHPKFLGGVHKYEVSEMITKIKKALTF